MQNKDHEDLTLYLAHLIEQEKKKGTSLHALGDRWGIRHSTLSILHKHLRGGGQTVETKIAQHLTGGSVDELRRRAKEWRRTNPRWAPAGYKPKGVAHNSGFAWWREEAARYLKDNPHLDWAVDAAAGQPAGFEPRPNRRRAYVERAANNVLDLPEEEQEELDRQYRRRTEDKPSKPAARRR